MLGKRIREDEYDKYDDKIRSVMMHWATPRHHNFIWDDQLIKKNNK